MYRGGKIVCVVAVSFEVCVVVVVLGFKMPGCAVTGCLSYSRKTKGTDVSYHSFPKDINMQKVWVTKCRRKDSFSISTATVCSLHFTADDYVRDLRAELLHLPPRKILKPEAVPSVNIPGSVSSVSLNTSADDTIPPNRADRLHARQTRQSALEHLANVSPKKRKIDQMSATEECDIDSEKIRELTKRVEDLEYRNSRLSAMCNKLTYREKCLKIKVKACVDKLKHQQKCQKKKVQEKVTEVLGKLFSKTQINCLLSGKKQSKWQREDICKAVTLRAVSRKCYLYLRNKVGFPLPGLSTLRRWTSLSFKCFPGVLTDVLQLMKAHSLGLSKAERVCVLSFDEMNVDSSVTYDSVEDRVIGPHSNVLFVMVRGLFSGWKQPIYYNFDTQITADNLNYIICCVQDIGYDVAAVVCDLGTKNRSVWKGLNVTETNSCFPNPQYEDKRVWVFSDVPHLFKLMRNHFLDEGLRLPSGKIVDKSIIERLLALDKNEMKLCPKLSQIHLSVKGRERQRVYLAMQLFSNTTAKAIKYLMPNEEEAANFFQLANDAFDILNARRYNDKNVLSCGYGIHKDAQERILRELYTCVEKMRVGNTNHLLPFQKGFMTSIRSLFGLFSDLQPLQMKYILTARLNQDALENFFSQLRGIGHFHLHPSPIEVKHRLRLLLLGHNADDIPLSNETPVQADDSDGFLTSHLFEGILPDMSEALEMVDGERELQDINFSLQSVREESAVQEGPDCSAEGFRYLAGYIAYRGKKYDDTLGTPTSDILSAPVTDTERFGWVEVLSRGGLTVPTDDWLRKVSQFELIFNEFNGLESVSKEKGIVKTICAAIRTKYPDFSPEIVKLYVRTRLFIRMRFLNMKQKMVKAAAAAKRKSRQWQSSSTANI